MYSHGDVHSLLHSSGTASQWLQSGLRWVIFMQDTNALGLHTLPAMLGVSKALSLEVNSLAIKRYAKQVGELLIFRRGTTIDIRHSFLVPNWKAIGGIAKLVHETTGEEMTVNVEYNQLDPLLKSIASGNGSNATGLVGGDENDPLTGCSPFPGNINQLLFSLEPYVATLQRTAGAMPEFVNPKYADASKTKFKKPTRLECMMQDYPRLLTKGSAVGFTVAPSWLCYSPCKNNAADAAASVLAGVPAGSAFIAESDQYFVFAEMLRRAGPAARFAVLYFFSMICVAIRCECGEGAQRDLPRNHRRARAEGGVPSVVPALPTRAAGSLSAASSV